jgi:cation diffusion facilitator CzcD-associated flavoprotein CzcO
LIVGAGISGIGCAYHLQSQCPGMSFVILESQESFGGTWLTHRYPGVRSDSDLYTFGYRFKPWVGKPIANAVEILAYLGEVIDENGLDKHIRYQHTISSARWSSAENLWTIEATRMAQTKPSGSWRIFSGCVRATIGTIRATRPRGMEWMNSTVP